MSIFNKRVLSNFVYDNRPTRDITQYKACQINYANIRPSRDSSFTQRAMQ